MCSHELLAECPSGCQMTVTVTLYLTSEHMTVGRTGWVTAIKPRVFLSRISSDLSHRASLHCMSSSSHLPHIR